MTYRFLAVVVLALGPLGVSAQALVPQKRQTLEASYNRQRQQLEAQIFTRFLNRASTEMKLDAPNRGRLEVYLRESGIRRRQLTVQTVQLRRRLNQAVRDSTTADADYLRILSELDQLRNQEDQLWKRDQDELAKMLNPRQRAVFILHWIQFNERLREIMSERPRVPPG